MERHQGHLKFYNSAREFGFVTEDETGLEFFCSKQSFVNAQSSRRGRVTFEIEHGRRGPRAVNIEFEKSIYED
jgi:CspA family cold shock protein